MLYRFLFPKSWRRYWASLRTFFADHPAKARGRPRCRPGVEQLEGRLTPSSVTWTGDGDGSSWGDAANWDSRTVPTAADDVTASSSTPVVVQGAAAAGSLQFFGALELQGGAALDLFGKSGIDGTIDAGAGAAFTLHAASCEFGTVTMTGAGLLRVTDGATAFIEGMLAVQNMALEPTGTVAGLGPLYVNASLDWSGGAMTGIGVTAIAAGAVLNIDGPDVKGLAGWGLDNAGQICWSGGDIDATGAGLSNQAGALLNMQADVSWLDPSRTSAWNNSGTIRKSGGTGTSEIDAAINDNGFVSVEAANMEFDGGGGLAGNMQVQQGLSLTLGAGVFNLLPGFTIAGNGFHVEGTLNGEDVGIVVGSNVTIPNFRMTRGTLMGTGNLVVNRMDWIGGNMADSGTTTV
jgi:hypothetical protein